MHLFHDALVSFAERWVIHMKAIRKEGYEEGIEAGREEGREEGRYTLLETQIRKKLAKGKSIEVIADEVEEDLDTVKAIMLKFCDSDMRQ